MSEAAAGGLTTGESKHVHLVLDLGLLLLPLQVCVNVAAVLPNDRSLFDRELDVGFDLDLARLLQGFLLDERRLARGTIASQQTRRGESTKREDCVPSCASR